MRCSPASSEELWDDAGELWDRPGGLWDGMGSCLFDGPGPGELRAVGRDPRVVGWDQMPVFIVVLKYRTALNTYPCTIQVGSIQQVPG